MCHTLKNFREINFFVEVEVDFTKYFFNWKQNIRFFTYSLDFFKSWITSSDCCCLSSEFRFTFSKVVSNSVILDFISSFLPMKLEEDSISVWKKKSSNQFHERKDTSNRYATMWKINDVSTNHILREIKKRQITIFTNTVFT